MLLIFYGVVLFNKQGGSRKFREDQGIDDYYPYFAGLGEYF